jgi:hypothetical protein
VLGAASEPNEVEAAFTDDDEPLDMDLPELDDEPPRFSPGSPKARDADPPRGSPARSSIPPQESAKVPAPASPLAVEVHEEPVRASPPGARESGRRAVAPDFKFLFKGYRVWALTDGTVVFGQRYGSHLLDVHQYHVEGDATQAYRRFLEDKISERFVPHTERSQVLPAASAGDSLDWELLSESFVRINS